MVCIPCIVAPLLLWIWYKFIQPVVLKIWNPWEPKLSVKDSSANTDGSQVDKAAKCPISRKQTVEKETGEVISNGVEEVGEIKKEL